MYKERQILAAMALSSILAFSQPAVGQQYCQFPTAGDSATAAPGDPTIGQYDAQFTMTLDPLSNNYSGMTITEYDAAPGSDSCANAFTNPAYIPPTNGVSGGTWMTVGSGYNPYTWGTDYVGFKNASAEYIINNRTIIPFPCGGVAYQALDITCPGGGTPYLYQSSDQLISNVYSGYFESCRIPSIGPSVCGPEFPF